MTADELERLRAEVAEADRAILAAANRRLDLVRRIQELKRQAGTPFVDPGQERRLLAALHAANPGPLSDEAVRELFERILELVKRELAAKD